jgi:hypothetical protein
MDGTATLDSGRESVRKGEPHLTLAHWLGRLDALMMER